MVNLIRVLSVTGCVLLGGCASLSQNDCRSARWQMIGERDAGWGYEASRVDAHREACFRYGVQPDFAAYQDGYARGLQSYCTYKGGHQAGYKGLSYRHICPKSTEAEFLEGYRLGRQQYNREEFYDLRDRYFYRHHRYRYGFYPGGQYDIRHERLVH
ncbi:MAG: DUF2799 domain-containing protein [Marinobacterium sp.]|nr:DUF2799 domain-containing protein [Marinobacterium sp.]